MIIAIDITKIYIEHLRNKMFSNADSNSASNSHEFRTVIGDGASIPYSSFANSSSSSSASSLSSSSSSSSSFTESQSKKPRQMGRDDEIADLKSLINEEENDLRVLSRDINSRTAEVIELIKKEELTTKEADLLKELKDVVIPYMKNDKLSLEAAIAKHETTLNELRNPKEPVGELVPIRGILNRI